MFNNPEFNYKYSPILALSPAEMMAVEELPDKAKDIFLPLIPLKGWVGSKKLENSIPRIEKAIGEDRKWIADIDTSFVTGNLQKQTTGEYPREVFYEIEELLSPENGYNNWCEYLIDYPKAIPTLQIQDLSEIAVQLQKLSSLGRGIVIKFDQESMITGNHWDVLKIAASSQITDILVMLDYGQVNKDILTFASGISYTITQIHRMMPDVLIGLSCSSFPSNFSGYRASEHSIYERMLFNIVSKACAPDVRMLYSDRGSARAEKIGGGGGIPSPRIDYPLQNDWKFIRYEFSDSSMPEEGEKEALYTKIALTIMDQEYWQSDLRVWGTQIIELTSKGDQMGINSPTRATAVRINIHLHNQLYYNALEDLMDTEEDWVD